MLRGLGTGLCCVIVVAGCGSVSGNEKMDAHVDSPRADTGATPDMPPAMGTTAIGAGDITTFTLPSQTFKTVPYASIAYDDLSEYDTTTSTFTVKYAGDYRVCASLYLTNNFAVALELDLFKNDVRERALAYGTGIATGCRVTRLAANDTVQVRAYQSSAGNVTTDPQVNWQWMTIDRVTAVAAIENTAQVPISSGAFTKIPYANEIFDDGSQFDPATSRFTATQAGDYEVCATFDLGSTTGQGELDLYVNDSRERALSYDGAAINGCRALRMAAGDNVSVYLDESATTTIAASQYWDWLSITKQSTSVSVTAITSFSTTTHVFTKVPYATEAFDVNGEFDVGTNTFTAASAGDYQICASLVTFGGTSDDELDIYKNGAREKGLSFGHVAVGGCRTMRLAANDQIQLWVYTGTNVNFTSDPNWDWFEVTKLH